MSIDLKTKTRSKTQRPRQFVVKFINDDFTPMNFVVVVMIDIFKMSFEEAEQKMLQVHKQGHAVHGPMTHEVAEARVTMAMDWAKTHEFPFRCSVEEG